MIHKLNAAASSGWRSRTLDTIKEVEEAIKRYTPYGDVVTTILGVILQRLDRLISEPPMEPKSVRASIDKYWNEICHILLNGTTWPDIIRFQDTVREYVRKTHLNTNQREELRAILRMASFAEKR